MSSNKGYLSDTARPRNRRNLKAGKIEKRKQPEIKPMNDINIKHMLQNDESIFKYICYHVLQYLGVKLFEIDNSTFHYYADAVLVKPTSNIHGSLTIRPDAYGKINDYIFHLEFQLQEKSNFRQRIQDQQCTLASQFPGHKVISIVITPALNYLEKHMVILSSSFFAIYGDNREDKKAKKKEKNSRMDLSKFYVDDESKIPPTQSLLIQKKSMDAIFDRANKQHVLIYCQFNFIDKKDSYSPLELLLGYYANSNRKQSDIACLKKIKRHSINKQGHDSLKKMTLDFLCIVDDLMHLSKVEKIVKHICINSHIDISAEEIKKVASDCHDEFVRYYYDKRGFEQPSPDVLSIHSDGSNQ